MFFLTLTLVLLTILPKVHTRSGPNHPEYAPWHPVDIEGDRCWEHFVSDSTKGAWGYKMVVVPEYPRMHHELAGNLRSQEDEWQNIYGWESVDAMREEARECQLKIDLANQRMRTMPPGHNKKEFEREMQENQKRLNRLSNWLEMAGESLVVSDEQSGSILGGLICCSGEGRDHYEAGLESIPSAGHKDDSDTIVHSQDGIPMAHGVTGAWWSSDVPPSVRGLHDHEMHDPEELLDRHSLEEGTEPLPQAQDSIIGFCLQRRFHADWERDVPHGLTDPYETQVAPVRHHSAISGQTLGWNDQKVPPAVSRSDTKRTYVPAGEVLNQVEEDGTVRHERDVDTAAGVSHHHGRNGTAGMHRGLTLEALSRDQKALAAVSKARTPVRNTTRGRDKEIDVHPSVRLIKADDPKLQVKHTTGFREAIFPEVEEGQVSNPWRDWRAFFGFTDQARSSLNRVQDRQDAIDANYEREKHYEEHAFMDQDVDYEAVQALEAENRKQQEHASAQVADVYSGKGLRGHTTKVEQTLFQAHHPTTRATLVRTSASMSLGAATAGACSANPLGSGLDGHEKALPIGAVDKPFEQQEKDKCTQELP